MVFIKTTYQLKLDFKKKMPQTMMIWVMINVVRNKWGLC